MNTTPGRKTADKPLMLGKHHEAILQMVHFYRYMTALDVTYRLYSPKALTHARSLLSALAGGADYQPNQYLYRFPLPQSGKTERIYTLGSRGRDFLASELGLPVGWYFRPHKVRHFSLGRVMHQLVLTRFLVAAHAWCKERPDFKLAQTRISYELEKSPPRVELSMGERTESLIVIPDAWLLFEEFSGGAHRRWLPVLVEIDRGTEYQRKFKQHLRSRIEFIRSGGYEEVFGQRAQTKGVQHPELSYSGSGEPPAKFPRHVLTVEEVCLFFAPEL